MPTGIGCAGHAQLGPARPRARDFVESLIWGGAAMTTATVEGLGGRVRELLSLRTEANAAFFEANAGELARCCHRMAERFARGGRLVAIGHSAAARSDVRHVAVEFVHPVIVGKRALPAIGLAAEGGSLGAQVEAVVEADDIAIAFGAEEPDAAETIEALAAARARGAMTIAFTSAGAEWQFEPPGEDPFVRQELIETLYHVLWELVHVFFDHRGLLAGREARAGHDAGGSSFLYPFLAESETDLDAVTEDVRGSVLMKSAEIGALREQTLGENAERLAAAAIDLRSLLDSGGRLLACGNGGSATDAMDLVADLTHPAPRAMADPSGDRPDRGFLDPDGDRQRHRRRGDLPAPGDRLRARAATPLIVLSTSGNSENLIVALAEARRRGLRPWRWSATTAAGSPPRASPTT